jgi:hypothetical protein
MEGRPGDSYRVRSRIERRPSRLQHVALVAGGIVVAIWAGVTLTAPRVPLVAVTSPAPSRPALREVLATDPSGRTFPPDVERLGDIPSMAIPALGFGGLSWFETDTAEIRSLREGWVVEWVFTWADGSTACICHRRAEDDPNQVRHLLWFMPGGAPSNSFALDRWPLPAEERTVAAVAWDPTAAAMYVASAVERPDGWEVRLSLLDSTGEPHATVTLDDAAVPGVDVGMPRDMSVWIAPDGRRARVRLGGAQGQGTGRPQSKSWDVAIDGAELGRPEEVPAPQLPPDTVCGPEGWATPSAFVAVCRVPGTGDRDGLLLLRDRVDSEPDQLELGDAGGTTAWVVDQTSGQVFGWDPFEHRLTRANGADLGHDSHAFDFRSGADAVPPDARWPDPREGRAAWLPRANRPLPPGFELRPLVGSADGSVIHAAGYAPETDVDRLDDSSGIWTFDADTLRVVAHWPAVGTYDSLALTPDGRYVIALGGPTLDELSAFGNHGRTIAFHDARSGEPALVLRHQVSGEVFLVPEPFP